MASSSCRIHFSITPLCYVLRLRENLSIPLVITFTIIPFATGSDRDRIWSLTQFIALGTDRSGIIRETVCNIMKCRAKDIISTIGTGDPFAQNLSDKVFRNVHHGLRQYGLELQHVRVVADETKTDAIETKVDNVENEADDVENMVDDVKAKPDAVETPEIHGSTTAGSSEFVLVTGI